MRREYFSNSIETFLTLSANEILGEMARQNPFALELMDKKAWTEEIEILKSCLAPHSGQIYFEYSIPRLGQRIDVILLIGSVLFVLEFKIGETAFNSSDIDQVTDYALDLKNFHESSHDLFMAPVLIASSAKSVTPIVALTPHNDKLLSPIRCNAELLGATIQAVIDFSEGAKIDPLEWEKGRYCPTPTIIEAAMALYSNHSVDEISRSDAGAINLKETSEAISKIIADSRSLGEKSICFVTGVPGAGKTLVGLNIATKHIDKTNELYSVFLSGNGPLVDVMREALARDKIRRLVESGKFTRGDKGRARSEVKSFIQNVHNFRDECLSDPGPPIEHVALFDEAQRAWNLKQTANFMSQKKNRHGFEHSEPEFLISCLDRHHNWAVVVCLVGGGQEINTGEAGIGEWIASLNRSFPKWNIYISPRISDNEYQAGNSLQSLLNRPNVFHVPELHLSVSMRSFRAENVSLLVKQLLDLELDAARQSLLSLKGKYPIVITRNLKRAKQWLKSKARGSERYGIVVSSQAERLRPHAIFVKAPMDPVNWFLEGKDDIRSSYYLEDVATEFHVQGLELDWACVTWDGDFRYSPEGWEHWAFKGKTWQHINKPERQVYQKNAYRVLMTRARQGMVLVVPEGDNEDPTRNPAFYDSTYNYLEKIGFEVI